MNHLRRFAVLCTVMLGLAACGSSTTKDNLTNAKQNPQVQQAEQTAKADLERCVGAHGDNVPVQRMVALRHKDVRVKLYACLEQNVNKAGFQACENHHTSDVWHVLTKRGRRRAMDHLVTCAEQNAKKGAKP